jgi:hypothetical protein
LVIKYGANILGGENATTFRAVHQSDDGKFVAGGYVLLSGLGMQMYLLKTDSFGNTLWQNNYGNQFEDICYDFIPTPDGGYLLSGTAFHVFKVDSSGYQLWWNDLTWLNPDNAYICEDSDGSYTIAGSIWNSNTLVVHMSGLQQAWVHLQPAVPHISIPAQGGSFQFTATLTNCGTIPCNPHIWAVVRLPNGQYMNNPVFGPILVPLNTGQVISRLRVQSVTASVPAGEYLYKSYTGVYLWHEHTRWDSSSFTFTKEGSGVWGLGSGNWSCTGDPFPGEENPPLKRGAGGDQIGGRGDLVAASPNPFNASTALSYELRAMSLVSLKVYNIAGQVVATLADGFREAGSYSVTFDGSDLPSGIYLYRLQTGQNTASGKLLLLK